MAFSRTFARDGPPRRRQSDEHLAPILANEIRSLLSHAVAACAAGCPTRSQFLLEARVKIMVKLGVVQVRGELERVAVVERQLG